MNITIYFMTDQELPQLEISYDGHSLQEENLSEETLRTAWNFSKKFRWVPTSGAKLCFCDHNRRFTNSSTGALHAIYGIEDSQAMFKALTALVGAASNLDVEAELTVKRPGEFEHKIVKPVCDGVSPADFGGLCKVGIDMDKLFLTQSILEDYMEIMS